jgi:diacylglycerol kinase (ATP)
LLDKTEAALRSHGIRVSLSPTTGPNSAAAIVRESLDEGADLIAVLGGDGTVNEVVNGLAGSHVPLVVLPGGTANVLCTELKAGSNAVKVAAELKGWVAQRIALGRVHTPEGSRYFLLMAGVGLDAHIVYHLHPGLKKLLGKGAYWQAGFASLLRKLDLFEAVVDARRRRGVSFSLVSRVRNYGGDLEIARGANLLDDAFETVYFEGANPFPYLKYFAGVLTGNLKEMRGVSIERTAAVELAPSNGTCVHIQVDGEEAGSLPARIEIVPDVLTLLMPREFAASRQLELPAAEIRSF